MPRERQADEHLFGSLGHRDELDDVIVPASGGTRRVHYPDAADDPESTEPLCRRANQSKDFLRKSVSMIPAGYYPWCHWCLVALGDETSPHAAD